MKKFYFGVGILLSCIVGFLISAFVGAMLGYAVTNFIWIFFDFDWNIAKTVGPIVGAIATSFGYNLNYNK